ncbi:hypothetical protein BJV82DRAFT_598089 [Fennellomyces sp. T-0311]|nr:hypothetical protein BJV82DRAFT_598089 [Fennellomyces sp. T-0311]
MANYGKKIKEDERIQLLPEPSTPSSSRVTAALPTSKREVLGLIAIAMSALAVSGGAIFVKLGSKIFPTSQILVFRFSFQAVLSLAGCYWLEIHPLGQRDGRKWVLIRGIVGSFSSMSWYYAIKCLPLADATVIMNMNPMFAAIFAAVMLDEPFGWFERGCAMFSLMGVILVTKPSFLDFMFESTLPSHDHDMMLAAAGIDPDPTRTIGILSALVAAITSAAAYVSVRIAGPRAHFLNHMLSLSVISIVLNSLGMSGFVMPQNSYQLGVLCMVASTAFIGQCLLNRGLQLAPSGPGTLMCMNEIVFAFLFGVFVFHEYPDWMSILGATMIVGVCTALGLKKWSSH